MSQHTEITSGFPSLCSQPMPQHTQSFGFSNSEIAATLSGSQGSGVCYAEHYPTLESTQEISIFANGSPSIGSTTSSWSPFSPHSSSLVSEDQLSFYNALNDLVSLGGATIEDEFNMMQAYESDSDDSSSYSRILEIAPKMDLKELLITCAELVGETDSISSSRRQSWSSVIEELLKLIEERVSVFGDPLQRLGAYMLEGLRAKLFQSGFFLYKKLRCEPINPSSSELMSYMHTIYEICPYFKFAYVSSTVIINEAMENERRIHIIDFQIAQGSQWIAFIQSVAHRPGGPPTIRITGVDDPQSTYARGGGLHILGQRLANVAAKYGVPFEFHSAAMCGTQVQLENLHVRNGDAIAVNFPYVLHHMPDEGVTVENHRDRILRLVKHLSPKIVTIIEQESNTNTSPFVPRFRETLDYYTAMFESIDAKGSREDKVRISTEQNCVAKDVVNIIACEGLERVERHEPFGKWRSRLGMGRFSQVQLSPAVGFAVREMLRSYSPCYRVWEENGGLYLGWKNRAMSTCSAWR